jgi:hypothetical protein
MIPNDILFLGNFLLFAAWELEGSRQTIQVVLVFEVEVEELALVIEVVCKFQREPHRATRQVLQVPRLLQEHP